VTLDKYGLDNAVTAARIPQYILQQVGIVTGPAFPEMVVWVTDRYVRIVRFFHRLGQPGYMRRRHIVSLCVCVRATGQVFAAPGRST
jgi:hypothetical protein